MTETTRSTLKAAFENGDVPQGSDYANLIDSAVNPVDSSAQTITSKLTISGGMETTNVTAQRVFASAATYTGTVSAATLNATTLQGTTVSAVAAFATSANIGHGTITRLGVGTASPSEGLHIVVSGDTNIRIDVPSTIAANVGASGPVTPASVAGFIPIIINGVRKKLAFYDA